MDNVCLTYVCSDCGHSVEVGLADDMTIYEAPFAIHCEKCDKPMFVMKYECVAKQTLFPQKHVMHMIDGKAFICTIEVIEVNGLRKQAPPIVHGCMLYNCESCGVSFPVYLETGIEEFGEDHKPSPFCVVCPFCKKGFANDVIGIHRIPGNIEVPLIPNQYYFANIEGRPQGKLMYYNGDGESVDSYDGFYEEGETGDV